MKKHMQRKYQAGISLLEVLLSLSIIAIILVMATRYFFVASNADRINIARQEVGELIAATHSWKNQNPTYGTGLTISQLFSDGFLANSSNMSQDRSKMYDPWGQEIGFTSSATGVTITMTLPTAPDCTSLLNSYPSTPDGKGGQCSGSNNNQFSINFS